MTTRKYSLAEIDRMREDLLWLRKNPDPRKAAGLVSLGDLEDELRTIMSGGVGAAELHADRQFREEMLARKQAWQDAEIEVRQRLCGHPRWAPRHSQHCLVMAFCHGFEAKCEGSRFECPITCVYCLLRDRRMGGDNRSARPGGRREGDKPKVAATLKPAASTAGMPTDDPDLLRARAAKKASADARCINASALTGCLVDRPRWWHRLRPTR